MRTQLFSFMQRGMFHLVPVVAVCCTLFGCTGHRAVTRTAQHDRKPNVILFLIDDFGYGDISFEGNRQINTPNIDRIAKAGARFTRFYQSGAACAPTRAAILTGRYALRTGVWDVIEGRDFLRRDEKTLGDAFREAGYTTGAFGKWHSGKVNSYFSWNRGFDVGVHPKLYVYNDSYAVFNSKLVHCDGWVTNTMSDQVIRFIASNKDNPFFAYVPFQDVHEPYNCPPELFAKYKAQGYSDHVARLYGMIELLDQNIGRILDAVDREGLKEETLVVFLSDDGPSHGFDLSYNNRRMTREESLERSRAWSRQLRGSKGTLWEAGVITPCYMAWPGQITPGRVIKQIAAAIDLYPTLIEACGIQQVAQPLPLDGQSLWSLVRGGDVPGWDDRFYFDNSNFYQVPVEAINRRRPQVNFLSVQHQQFKLVRQNNALYGGPDSVFYHLFDLARDPEEKQNVWGQHPEMAVLLRDTLNGWFDDILRSGRGFYQAEYTIGGWDEPETPINADGMSSISGTLKRNSLLWVENWDKVGNSLTYPIDVLETGIYEVEVSLRTSGQRGAVFHVTAPSDTAMLTVTGPDVAVSGPLHLAQGPQVLTLELLATGLHASAVDATGHWLVRRLPQPSDQVIRNPRFHVQLANGTQHGPFQRSSVSADFMNPSRPRGMPVAINRGDSIIVRPVCDNPGLMKRVMVYYDFNTVYSVSAIPAEGFLVSCAEKGTHTVNVEFESASGVRNSAYALVQVR